jgi:hypothetical protein
VKRVAILTDFINFDPAYSLCRVVANQVKMLVRGGYKPRLIVRAGFGDKHRAAYEGAEIVVVDPGGAADNQVRVTAESEAEIARLALELGGALCDVDVVLTHDLIFQPNLWKHHVAARRLAWDRDGLQWLHWVHSPTDLGTVGKTGRYKRELQGKFPNSRLVAMHREAVKRQGGMYGYEVNEIVVIPNPIDFCGHMHPVSKRIVTWAGLMAADVVAVYPVRLDRGKQPHIIVEIFSELVGMGYDVRVVIADFHSTGGDKVSYRGELKRRAERSDVPLFFTSEMEGAWDDIPLSYLVPHQVVMDLFEVADVLVQCSVQESDSLILAEAAWKRNGLILNFDLPLFRQYDGSALLYKFSSKIDVHTGQLGDTTTEYGNRRAYMRGVAGGIAYLMEHNSVLRMHAEMRKTRSLEAVWKKLWAAIEG